ncbi:MAG: Hly-III family protein [Deinococcus-Thermus bacterium]|nr:Hly-III family protein [Deinococcota bacterium]
MSQNLISREHYSRAEHLSDVVVHLVALAAAIVGVPILITLAAVWHGDASAVTAIAVYGASLIAMIGCSALYNGFPSVRLSWLYQRLDHAAIYVKIAGTYTPFTLLTGQGGWLLTGLWGAALAGSWLRIFASPRWKWIAFALYLVMGWAGVAVGWPMLAALSAPIIALMLAGGILYTVGTVFLLWQRLPFHNTIWHVFVMAASAAFFVAVTLLLAQSSALLAATP